MALDERQQHDDPDEVTRRNVEQARELLAQQHQQEQQRADEPPLQDDRFHPDPEVRSNEPTGARGSTGGQRNLGGGRS